MTTTVRASVPMLWIMPRRSQFPPCKSRAEKRFKVATIRLLLKYPVAFPKEEEPASVFAEFTARNGAPAPRPAHQPVLLVQRENHVDSRVHFHRFAVQKRRPITPLPNRIQRRLLQKRMAAQDFELLNRAVFADDGVQADGSGNAGLA